MPDRKQINMLLLTPHIAIQVGPQYLRPLLLTRNTHPLQLPLTPLIFLLLWTMHFLLWRHHLHYFISWEYTDTHQAQIYQLFSWLVTVFLSKLCYRSRLFCMLVVHKETCEMCTKGMRIWRKQVKDARFRNCEFHWKSKTNIPWRCHVWLSLVYWVSKFFFALNGKMYF